MSQNTKRIHESQGINVVSNHLYHGLNDCGRRWALPGFWLLLRWVAYGCLSLRIATENINKSIVENALSLSAAQLIGLALRGQFKL